VVSKSSVRWSKATIDDSGAGMSCVLAVNGGRKSESVSTGAGHIFEVTWRTNFHSRNLGTTPPYSTRVHLLSRVVLPNLVVQLSGESAPRNSAL
jgi:hypothetical protein